MVHTKVQGLPHPAWGAHGALACLCIFCRDRIYVHNPCVVGSDWTVLREMSGNVDTSTVSVKKSNDCHVHVVEVLSHRYYIDAVHTLHNLPCINIMSYRFYYPSLYSRSLLLATIDKGKGGWGKIMGSGKILFICVLLTIFVLGKLSECARLVFKSLP